MRPLSLLPFLISLACSSTNPTEAGTKASPSDSPPTTKTDSTPAPPPIDPTPVEPADDALRAEVASGFNAFGLDLYEQIAKTPGNSVVSPASIAMALTMTHAGARGATATELAEALHLQRPSEDVHRAAWTMLRDWNAATEDTQIAMANRLYGETSTPWEPDFLALGQRFFSAPLQPVSFTTAAEDARTTINGWVEDRTHERIRDLLPPGSIDSTTRLVLANALYFKARWQHPFDEFATAAATFTAPSGEHEVPMMHVTEHFQHAAIPDDGVQVLQMPYADGRYAMTVVLPDAADGLGAIESKLSAESLDRWIGLMSSAEVQVTLPSFRIEPADSLSLSEALGSLGVELAFTDAADFSGMTTSAPGVKISEVFHKGFIEVDEAGTEAAAATAVVMMEAGAAMPSAPPVQFVADHPFLYLVRDTHSGMVLFMGRLEQPTTGE